LLKLKSICEVPCQVSLHEEYNSSRGIVYINEYSLTESDKFCEELKKRLNAREVQRATWIPTRENGGTALLITFSDSSCPPSISIPGESGDTKVSEYITRPSFCKNCLDYSHREKHCKAAARCAKCSSTNHKQENCTTPTASCLHCKGEHQTGNKSCRRWKQECEIAAIKYKSKLSWTEAKQQFFRNYPDEQKAYAEMMQPQRSQGTATAEVIRKNIGVAQIETGEPSMGATASIKPPRRATDEMAAVLDNLPSNPSVRRRDEVSSDDDGEETTKKRGRLGGELDNTLETLDEDDSSENNEKIRREVFKMYEEFEQSTSQ